MAGEPRNLTVSLSPEALLALDEVWDWNARQYSSEHANEYVAFLLQETNKLSENYPIGKAVPKLPRLSYIVIQKQRKGHGHLVIFELIDDVIQVLHYYHTAQNWLALLLKESRH